MKEFVLWPRSGAEAVGSGQPLLALPSSLVHKLRVLGIGEDRLDRQGCHIGRVWVIGQANRTGQAGGPRKSNPHDYSRVI